MLRWRASSNGSNQVASTPSGGASGSPSTATVRASMRQEWPGGLLLALQAVFWWQPLVGKTFFLRDLYKYSYPQRRLLARFLANGVAPTWDPFHHGGMPFLADPNSPVLYPTSALYALLPTTFAFNLEIVLHFVLLAVAGYALARVLGLSPKAALVSGLALELSGCALSLVSLPTRVMALSHVPLLLLAWHRWCTSRRPGWLVLSACCGALMTLAGFPELALVVFPWLLAWALVHEGSGLTRRSRLLPWLGVTAASLGLAAVQLVPTALLTRGAARGSGIGFAEFATFSLHPKRLPELLLPGFLGRVDGITDAAYWGHALEDTGFPYLPSVYLGVSVVILAVHGLLGTPRTNPLGRRTRVLLAGTAAASVLFALGRHLPGMSLLYNVLPPLHLVRFPVKAMVFAVLPLALLAGAGADRLARDPGGLARRAWLAVALIGGALALATGAVLLASGSEVAAGLHASYFSTPLDAGSSRGLARSLGHAAAALAATGTLLLGLVGRRFTWAPGAAAAVVAADLWSFGSGLNPMAGRDLLESEPYLAGQVRQLVGEGSLYRAPLPPQFLLAAPVDDIAWQVRWELVTLAGYTGAAFGVPVIFHHDYDGMPSREILELGRLVESLPWPRRLDLLAAVGVRAVLSQERVDLPGLTPIGVLPSASTAPLRLYRVEGAAPRARLVASWRAVASFAEALAVLADAGEAPPAGPVIEAEAGSTSDASPSGTVQLRSSRPVLAEYLVDSPEGGMLVLTTPYYSGWRVRVDGREAPVRRANAAFQAVPVGPGRHVVVHTYTAPGLRVGLVVSALTALLVLGWAAVPRRARREEAQNGV